MQSFTNGRILLPVLSLQADVSKEEMEVEEEYKTRVLSERDGRKHAMQGQTISSVCDKCQNK